jgi:sugar phosphate isomerase/epimerase
MGWHEGVDGNDMTTPIALQLYTLRDALVADFAGVIEKVAAMGYVGVERAFFTETMSAAEATKIIQANGLTVASAHAELPLGDEQKRLLGIMADAGTDVMIWHGWPRHEDHNSVDGVKRLAELYNRANAVAQANGLRFGIHNHWWEFEPVGDTYPYRILAAEMEESIFFEVDTYWVRTGGLDPAAVLRELGERVPFLHIKDGPATPDGDMVAVGQGVMDFPAVFAAAQRPQWMVVELDRCATDMMTAVQESFNYLTSNDFAKGKS